MSFNDADFASFHALSYRERFTTRDGATLYFTIPSNTARLSCFWCRRFSAQFLCFSLIKRTFQHYRRFRYVSFVIYGLIRPLQWEFRRVGFRHTFAWGMMAEAIAFHFNFTENRVTRDAPIRHEIFTFRRDMPPVFDGLRWALSRHIMQDDIREQALKMPHFTIA